MKVAAIQFDVRRTDVAANLRSAEEGLRRAAAQGVQLAVLPELWPTSFPGPDTDVEEALVASEQALLSLARLSAELDLLVCGSALARPETAETPEGWRGKAARKPLNRLHLVDGERTALAYDKVHLFSPTAEPEALEAGSQPPSTAVTRLGRISGAICYDLRFPELLRIPFREAAQVVCVPSQWPSPRAGHLRALVCGLAVQNQCFVVAANRTGAEDVGRRELRLEFPGNSIVAGPSGEILAEGQGEEGVIAADIDLALARELRARVPVARDQRPDLYAEWAVESRHALVQGERLSGGF